MNRLLGFFGYRAFLAGVLLGYCHFANSNECNPPPESSPQMSFTALSVDEGRRAIVDEQIEPYFSVLQPMEISALTATEVQVSPDGLQLAEMRESTRTFIQDHVTGFSADEASLLHRLAARIDELQSADFPLLAAQPWKLVKLDSRCCATGHTRGDAIVLASHGMDELMQLWQQSGDIDVVLAGRGRLLLHEKVHIAQRFHPELFAALYAELWGFTHVAAPVQNPWLLRHMLHNPDAADLGYLIGPGAASNAQQSAVRLQLRTLLIPEDPLHPKMGKDFHWVALELVAGRRGWEYLLDAEGIPRHKELDTSGAGAHPLVGKAPRAALAHGGDHPHEIFAYTMEEILLNNYLVTAGEGERADSGITAHIRSVAMAMLANVPPGC